MAVPVFNHWYFSEVVAAAEAVLAEAGFDLLLSSIPTPEARARFITKAALRSERGDDRIAARTVPLERRTAYHQSLARAGLAHGPELEGTGDFTAEGGREAMAALLAADKRPTAVFAMSDDMAFGAIRAVADAGLRVPDGISVIGFDDHELADAFQLTTVRQHVARHGAIAARLLVDHINGAPVDHVSVPTDLVVRSTTAAAPNRAGSAPENVSGTCAIVHTDRRDGQVSSTVRTFGLIGRR